MDAGENNASIEASLPREDNPKGLKVEVMRAFKVTNNSRARKVGIMASSMGELEMKCRQKFKLQGQLSFVLAEDGTEVDFDYLQMIQTDSMLMVLHGEEHWEACKPDSPTVNVPDDKEEEVMKMVEKLRQSKNKRRKVDGKESRKGKDPSRVMTVQVGWQNFSYREKRYKLVKGTRERPDSGPTQLKLGINSTFEQIEATLKNHYFPGKRSPIGHEKKYTFCVGSFKGDEIDKSLTLGEFVSSKETKARIYLLSKPKFTGMTCITDSSSDSDFDLPRIPLPMNHRSSTVTEGDLRSTDNSDGLNVVTPPNLQDMPGSSSPINVVHLPDIEDMPGSSSQIDFNVVHLPDIQDMPGSSSQVMNNFNPSMTMAMASNPNTTMVMAVSPPTTHLVQAGTPQVSCYTYYSYLSHGNQGFNWICTWFMCVAICHKQVLNVTFLSLHL